MCARYIREIRVLYILMIFFINKNLGQNTYLLDNQPNNLLVNKKLVKKLIGNIKIKLKVLDIYIYSISDEYL